MCKRKLCVSTSMFHSYTYFRVLSIVTSQFWIDVWNFFSRSLSNSSHSVDRLKYLLTRKLISTFHTTFVLSFFYSMAIYEIILYFRFEHVYTPYYTRILQHVSQPLTAVNSAIGAASPSSRAAPIALLTALHGVVTQKFKIWIFKYFLNHFQKWTFCNMKILKLELKKINIFKI